MTESDNRLTQMRIERAAEWRALQRERSLDASESQAFLAWLRESPTHIAAYLEIVRVDHDVEAAARDWAGAFRPLEAEALEPLATVVPLQQASRSSRPTEAPRRASRRLRPLLLAAVAGVAVLSVGIVLALNDGQRFGLPKTYETAHAEQGSWPLPDGSMLHLNSDSYVIVRFRGDERLVTLQRGQAMFQVAKDAARRFRVEAGDTQVIAVGTEFDVYRRTEGTRVVVLEGRVAVVRGTPPASVPTLMLPGATAVRAGQQVEVVADRGVPNVVHADLRRARAWTQREIVLDGAPLAEVVEDFNRYSNVPIEIDGDELKALQISGVFGAYDVDSLLEFLRHLEGVRVEATKARIRILPAKPALPNLPSQVRDTIAGGSSKGANGAAD